jgi:hypothetical protein
MDEALLLGAIQGVVSGKEVRNENAFKVLEKRPKELSLSRVPILKVDRVHARKHPHVTHATFQLHLGLVNMKERSS